jgi:hypothetical protein
MTLEEATEEIEKLLHHTQQVAAVNHKNNEGPVARAYTEGRYSGLEDAIKIITQVEHNRTV